MVENEYYETLEGFKAFTNLVDCELCPLKIMCQDGVTVCDVLIDEIYEIEYKINMEG